MQFVATRFLNFQCTIPASEINRLQSIQRQKDSSILALNHSTLADSFSIQTLAYQAKLTPVTMAALENFDRKIANISYKMIWPIAQRLGYFSVNRGNQSIQKSNQHAQEILAKGQHPLLIFPEGRISWNNQQVGTCQNGTLRLALQASQAAGKTVRIIPVGVAYHYLPQARPQLEKLLNQNEKKLFQQTDTQSRSRPDQRIARLLNIVVARQENKYSLHYPNQLPPWEQRLEALNNKILQSMQQKYGLTTSLGQESSQQIRRLYTAVNQQQMALRPPGGITWLNPWSPAWKNYKSQRQQTQTDIHTLRELEILTSLPSPQIQSQTLTQQMETLLKLHCLIQNKRPGILTIIRNCRAQIKVGEPIVIKPNTLTHPHNLLNQASQLTPQLQKNLQQAVQQASLQSHHFSQKSNPV